MPNSKKYYWLKLKEDFFRNREVKKLRNIAGGDTYTIIYLKMQLISIQKSGIIVFEGTEHDLSEQLALELDEDLENIKITLSYLSANKLMEQLNENEYLLNKVPELIGAETTAAERMRKMREQRNNVTEVLQPVTNCYTEIEIERRDKREEIEIDKEENRTPAAPYKEIKELFNETCTSLSNVRNLSDIRRKHIKARWIQLKCDIDTFKEAFTLLENSSFCKGDNDRGWKADFDWIIKNDNNILKVLEGRYTDKEDKHGANRGVPGSRAKEDEYVAGFAELDLDEVFKVQNE